MALDTNKLKVVLSSLSEDAAKQYIPIRRLKTLLRRLDPQAGQMDNEALETFIDAVPKSANGQVGVATLVDWLWEVPKVFWSNHLTKTVENARLQWYGDQVDESTMSIRASMPPFNNKSGLPIPGNVMQLNVPVFGLIPNAVMGLFQEPEMTAVAQRLRVTIPGWGLNATVQSKMPKVLDLVKAARENESIAQINKDAIDKLEAFAKDVQALKAADMPGPAEWESFVLRHTQPGWDQKLHFDHVLSNFGFDKQASDTLRALTLLDKDGKEVTYEQHSLRWLGKAFVAFGPMGCFTDVVNLVFAMVGEATANLSEQDIVRHIQAFQGMLKRKELSNLWVPSHYVMDAENDDTLSWVLLERVHELLGSSMRTFIQLPTDPSLDSVAESLQSVKNCRVFRDPEAKNLPAVKANFGVG